MKRCEDCIHDGICNEWAILAEIPFVNADLCEHYKSTADVVPKSEVEEWKEIAEGYQKMFEDSYEKHQIKIANAKIEVAREIFEDIDRLLRIGVVEHSDCLDAYVKKGYAELKKKYTEGGEDE